MDHNRVKNAMAGLVPAVAAAFRSGSFSELSKTKSGNCLAKPHWPVRISLRLRLRGCVKPVMASQRRPDRKMRSLTRLHRKPWSQA
jgi:hypothetical protein